MEGSLKKDADGKYQLRSDPSKALFRKLPDSHKLGRFYSTSDTKICTELSILRQTYEIIAGCPKKGATQGKVVKRLNLRRKHVARIFQELLSKYGVKKVFHSVGKTSEYRYFINQSFVVPPQHCAPPQRQLPALQETDLDFLVKVSSLRSSRCTRCNDILEDCQKGYCVCFDCDFATCIRCNEYFVACRLHDMDHLVLVTDNFLSQVEANHRISQEHREKCDQILYVLSVNHVLEVTKDLYKSSSADLQKVIVSDSKTRRRLLKTLCMEKLVRLIRVSVALLDGHFKVWTLLLEPGLSMKSEIVRTYVRSLKGQYLFPLSHSHEGEKSAEKLWGAEVSTSTHSANPASSTHIRMRYGWIPARYQRCRLLHLYLWKLCFYSNKERTAEIGEVVIDDDQLNDNTLMTSVILENMPLSLFLQVLGLDHPSQPVQTCLSSPECAACPLKQLPPLVCRDLLAGRGYGPRFHATTTWLSKLRLVECKDFSTLKVITAATLSLHSSKSAALEVCRYKFDRSSAVKKWWDDLEAAVNFTQNFPVAGFDQSLGLNLMRYWKAVWTPSKEEANVLEAHYSAVDGLLSHLDFEQIALELGTSELNIRRYFLSKSARQFRALPKSKIETFVRPRKRIARTSKASGLSEKLAREKKSEEGLSHSSFHRRSFYTWTVQQDNFFILCYISSCIRHKSLKMNRQRYKDLAAAVNKHFEGEEPKDIRAFRSRLSVLLRSSELQLSVMGAYHAVLNAQQEVLHEYDSSSFDWEKAVGALEDALCRLLSPCHFGDFPVTEEELKTGFSLLKLDSTTPFSGLESFNDRDWPSSPSSLLTFHVTELVLILLFCGVPKLKGVGTLIFKDYHHLLEPVIRDLINKRVIKKSKSTLLLPWPLLPGHQVRTQLLDPLKTEIFENYFEAYEKFKTEILHNKSVALSEETAPQLFLVVLDCTAAGLAALDLSEPAAPFVDSFDDADVYSFVEACSVSLSLLQDNDSIFAANLVYFSQQMKSLCLKERNRVSTSTNAALRSILGEVTLCLSIFSILSRQVGSSGSPSRNCSNP
ncbi:uncharacterized protein LOC135119459 isoform X2 [Zophobas morio]|uniref:uncharacterized protein LOC135119459 isoform X2 n=1 Tax=Zophobas morio TaxID=2755281 RepID=UPI0030836DED